MTTPLRFPHLLCAVLALALAGCSTHNSTSLAGIRPSALLVTPKTATLVAGNTLQLNAVVEYSDGSTVEVTSSTLWSSSDAKRLTVSKGVATALSAGEVTVTASSNNLTQTVTLTVSAAELRAIQVTGASPGLARGTSEQLTATGVFSDGSSQDLTSQATWSSSASAVASVSAKGMVSALTPGAVTVTATAMNLSGTAQLAVSAAVLQSLDVVESAQSLALGAQQQLLATGHFSDGTSQDLTSSVTWTSGDAQVASVSNASGTQGKVTATGVGTTTLTATDATSGVTGSAQLQVAVKALTGIAVSSLSPSTPSGTPATFAATGTYSDGTTADLTSVVTWSTSDATVLAAPSTSGVSTTLSAGNVTVTATDASTGLSGSATFVVSPAALTGLTLSAQATTLALGTGELLTATGHYTDGTTADLTSSVSWTAADASVANVSNQTGSQGLVTAAAVGSTTVTATSAGGVTGSIDLSVSSAVLVSIAIDPPAPSIAKGTSRQFTATGTFSDHTTQDLTASASWTSSDTTVATVTSTVAPPAAPGSPTLILAASAGRAQGVGAGSAMISATFGGITGSAPLNVTSAVLQSLQMTPSSVSIPNGQTAKLSVTGFFSDNTTQDLTSMASWSVSSASVSVDTSAYGTVQGAAVGSADVTATVNGLSATSTVTVTDAILQTISIELGSDSLPAGVTEAVHATGHYSDGGAVDLTASASWTITNSNVLGYVFVPFGIQGVGPGVSTLMAQVGSTTASVDVQVTDATLSAITFTMDTTSVAAGTNAQLTAVGSYSDGSSRDITSTLTFTSSDTSVATVSNASGSHGQVHGLIAGGPVDVSASLGTTGYGTVASVTVTNAQLVSIAVSPTSLNLVGTQTAQLAATGTYTDGNTQDLTALAIWTSDNAGVANVSNAGGSNGLVQGASHGTANVTATMNGVTSNAVAVTDVDKALVSLAITPNPISLPSGTQQLTATGTYNDATQADLTSSVAWFSSDTSKYTVSAQGLVAYAADGNSTIYAVLGGVSAQAVAEPCPAGFYLSGGRCAYDYYLDLSNLVNVPYDCGNGVYYNYTGDQPNYGFQWQDLAVAGMTPTQISAQFSIGVSCDATTQSYALNGSAAGSITLADDCTCTPAEKQQSVDLTSVTASYVVGGSNSFIIDSPFSQDPYTGMGSVDYGFMPDSAVGGGHYVKVTVVY